MTDPFKASTREQLCLDFLKKLHPNEDWRVLEFLAEREELEVILYRGPTRKPALMPGDPSRFVCLDTPAVSTRSFITSRDLVQYIPSQWEQADDFQKMFHIVALIGTPRDDSKPTDDAFYEGRWELTDHAKILLTYVASELIAKAEKLQQEKTTTI